MFLKVDLYHMYLFLAFQNKIRGIFGYFLVKTLVLHTFWVIITLDLVWVSLSGRKYNDEVRRYFISL